MSRDVPPLPHDDAPFTLPKDTADRIADYGSRERSRREPSAATPVLEAADVSKYFGRVIALEHVSLSVRPGEVNCLLGDNGAGKSTLIKILSGVHGPDSGTLRMDGQPVTLQSPRDALDRGIATVYQDLAVLPLMSISRNFFVGSEPTVGWGPFKRFDVGRAGRIATEQMLEIGIRVRDPGQLVGTLSGGERQTVAIARAEYFGARVLILDEPTSALGVKEAAIVLRHVIRARAKGLGVIFITHNVQHALPVGDRFTILSHGRLAGEFVRGEVGQDELLRLMGGGDELVDLARELDELMQADPSTVDEAARPTEVAPTSEPTDNELAAAEAGQLEERRERDGEA
ncbi:MAG TPA: ATP-binding cassette domain-containing protein [Candidatus Limnocylindrales bacterium]|nr:ATP-binding cassette domain-containing protein [Candidatus Limnocylindrales bacterium]